MIQFHNIRKSFDRLLFQCENITLPTRGIVDLIAPSGAGKTTLLNMIKGLDIQYEGEIFVNGISAKKEMPKRIGYLSQNISFVNYHTIKWHFDIVCRGDKRKEKKRDRFIYRLRLDEILDIYPSELSNGERKRVGFALICLLEDPILLLDEPFADLMEDDILQIREMVEEESAKRLVIVSNHITAYRFNENVLKIDNQVLTYQGDERVNDFLEKKAARDSLWARNSFSSKRFVCKFLSLLFLFLSILCMSYNNADVFVHEVKRNDIPVIKIGENMSDDYYKQAEKMGINYLLLGSSDDYLIKDLNLGENETYTDPTYFINCLRLSSAEGRNFYYHEQEMNLKKDEIMVTDAWAKLNYKSYGLSSYQEMTGFNIPIFKTKISIIDFESMTTTFKEEITIYKKIVGVIDFENEGFNRLFQNYEASQKEEDYKLAQEYAKERNMSFIFFNYHIPYNNEEMYVVYDNYSQLKTFLLNASKAGIYTFVGINISEKLSSVSSNTMRLFMMMSEDFKGPLIILFGALSILLYLLFMKKQKSAEKQYFKFYNSIGMGKKEIYHRSELRVLIDTSLAALIIPLVAVPIMVLLNKIVIYVSPFSILYSLIPIVLADIIIQAVFVRAMKKF